MRNFLAVVLICLSVGACATTKTPATKLEKANVLPMELNDNFQFRKIKTFYDQVIPLAPTTSEAVIFEQSRRNWGAITAVDRVRRFGNYYSFFWRTTERADVTVRLEYRQAALGNYVMAKERYYPNAKGSYQSDFTVIGDEFFESGAVTAWRALLIADGKIVGLTQSYIWR